MFRSGRLTSSSVAISITIFFKAGRNMSQESNTAISIKQLLEAGAHFGHQTGRRHPRMRRYIFTQRNGIHILDLEKTVVYLERACQFVREAASRGEAVLFIGTKRQAQEPIEEEAKRCGMPFVNQRWIGGTLTNFGAIQSRIDYLVQLEDQRDRGEFSVRGKKEVLGLTRQIDRLNRRLGGIKEMTALPGAMFIVDSSKERIAIAEGRRVGIPIVAVVDTNCNPEEIDYPIPANDDAVRAIKLICGGMAEAVLEGKAAQGAADEAEMLEREGIPESLTFVPEEEEDADFGSTGEGAEGAD
jgi:small subunit ribosomal protein S2